MIALGPNGDLYVADLRNFRVQYFSPEGHFLGKWGSYSSNEGQFVRAPTVAVDAEGTVYV